MQRSLDLDFIKNRRMELGLSLLEVSNYLGYKAPSTYMRYEDGVYEIKAEMLPKLAKLLKCDIEDFFKV